MLRLLSISLLPLLISGQEFQCGTDKVQADIAKTVVQFNCKDKVSEINQCCGKHDGCYDEQQPRATCDAAFCSCVQAASAGNPLCGFYTSLFCDTAKVFGEPAYRKVGERKERERKAAAAAAAAATSTAAPTTTTKKLSPQLKSFVDKMRTFRKGSAIKWRGESKKDAKKFEKAAIDTTTVTPPPPTTTTVPTTTVPTTTVPTTTAPKVEQSVKEVAPEAEESEEDETTVTTVTSPAPRQTPQYDDVKANDVTSSSSSEEDDLAVEQARLDKEEKELKEAEEKNRKALEALEERKNQLREDLRKFRESQRRMWAKKEEYPKEPKPETRKPEDPKKAELHESEATTVSPRVEDATVVSTTSTTTEDPAITERRRVLRAQWLVRREQQLAKRAKLLQELEEHRAATAAAAAKRMELQRAAALKEVESKDHKEAEPKGHKEAEPKHQAEPKVTVTAAIEGSGHIEGSGEEGSKKAAWTDDDLVR